MSNALPLQAEPRIAPLQVGELTDELVTIVERFARLNAAIESRDQAVLHEAMVEQGGAVAASSMAALERLPEIIRTLLRHPDLFNALTDVGIQLLSRGALTARDRELAILRIGWLCRAPYEWGEHVIIAKKSGITSAEIERVTQGSVASGWSVHEAALLRAAEELHADAIISDPTWAELAKALNERQLIELPALIGQYQAVAYYQNSLRLRLHEGNLGLAAR
jgi:alkylhydroperoxidase family enzyme